MLKISVSIDVPDLAKGEAFYVDLLGCKKDRATIRNYQRHWTPIHLDILRDDVKDVADKVKEYRGEQEGGESGVWGSIAYCVDPFGNGFCIIKE